MSAWSKWQWHCSPSDAAETCSSVRIARMHPMCAINFYVSIISVAASAATAALTIFIYLPRTTIIYCRDENDSPSMTNIIFSSILCWAQSILSILLEGSMLCVWNNLLINMKCGRMKVNYRSSFATIQSISFVRRCPLMCLFTHPRSENAYMYGIAALPSHRKIVCLHKALAYIISAGAYTFIHFYCRFLIIIIVDPKSI